MKTLSSRPAAWRLVCAAALALLGAGGCGNTVVDVWNPDLGLLAHWAFDEATAGSIAADSSGFGLDGTPSANPPVPTRDIPPVHFPDPYSLSFNEQDQVILVGNPPILNLGGPISVAAWIRPMAVDGYRNIVAHGYTVDGSQDEALRIKSGTYEFTYYMATMEHDGIATIPDTDIGAWVHLCGVFDGGAYLVYRNGALAATTVDSTVPPPNIDALWSIGARAVNGSSAATRFLLGEIDDVRIYGRALSAPEVQALYER